MFSSNQTALLRKFSIWYSFCFCKTSISPDITGFVNRGLTKQKIQFLWFVWWLSESVMGGRMDLFCGGHVEYHKNLHMYFYVTNVPENDSCLLSSLSGLYY